MKCVNCDSTDTKEYIIGDDMENPRYYCDECHKELMMEVLISIGEESYDAPEN